MKIYSYIKHGYNLRPVEVELSLVPGIPKINFLGQPDLLIRESELRIKSALKHQGFKFPQGQQVVVNLKPSYLKKTSQGIDLAVACALLWKTGQVQPPQEGESAFFIYGTLGLQGGVQVPDDLEFILESPKGSQFITGEPENNVNINTWGLKELKGLQNLQYYPASIEPKYKKAPEIDESIKLSRPVAETLAVTAHGEHSIMLAGPAGSGKTTFAECLYQVLLQPDERTFRVSQLINKTLGFELDWRPYVAPHHTTTPLSMVGGGVPIFPGEITRAHGGVLLLDEFLEFKSEVKEALREPIEKGQITISRKGRTETFPAQFLLIGTTNLCPCGDLVPGQISSCRFSLNRCRSYSERLSGPILDRFQLMSYTHTWKPGRHDGVSLKEIKKWIQRGRKFNLKINGEERINSRLNKLQLEGLVDKGLENFMPEFGRSLRRKFALIKVARSFADIDESKEITPAHLEKAAQLSVFPFEKMRRLFS